MSRRGGDLSDELWTQARELYVTGQVSSLKELSVRSVELLGQNISWDSLKRRASAGPEGDWTVLRSQARAGNAELELEDIRTMIYMDIMNPETGPSSRAQLTNSYMTLLQKGNVKGKGSAKTSIEQALQLKPEALAELDPEDLSDDE